MQYGSFTDGGRAYTIHTPFTPTPWFNRLCNSEMLLEITQDLRGGGKLVHEDYSTEPFNDADNRFYISVNDTHYQLCRGQGSGFSCEHRLYQTTVTETFGSVQAQVSVFLPAHGRREYWTFRLSNQGQAPADVSLYSVFPFLRPEYMAFETEMDLEHGMMYYSGFPYYIKYDEKEEKEQQIRYRYIAFDTAPASWEGRKQRFFGGYEAAGIPVAVRNGGCQNGKGEFIDACIGAMQHRFHLAPGQSETYHLVLGIEKSREEMFKAFRVFPDVEDERRKARAVWEKRCAMFRIDTPDQELNALTNYWLKQQLFYLAVHNRGSTDASMRNQLQDYMAYALIEPKDAFNRMVRVLERQHFDGYYKSHYSTDGGPERGLQRNHFSDQYIWIVMCIVQLIESTGNRALYQVPVGYMDSPEKEPVLTHLRKAAHYMSRQLGAHGLCLLLDGDWNDPINGPGRKGRGESMWNSAALCYAISLLNEVAYDAELDAVRKRLMDAVNTHCWDGAWYATGLDDDGQLYGAKSTDGQKFLNAQTWAIISGIATGERLEKTIQTIESLRVPFGYLIMDPPFTAYNPIWGKVSLKQQGTTENGSVYNHAVMFKAYADCVRGDAESARQTVLSILPGNPDNPPEHNCQIPIYYSNYYVGRRNENFGISSCAYSTGTVSWHFYVILQAMFGFRTKSDGTVSLSPCLPEAWKNASMERVVGNTRYSLRFTDGKPSLTVTEG